MKFSLPLVLAATAAAAASSAPQATASASAYPSFSDFNGAPYNVSYDKRALTLNGEHVVFLSGAIHPPRGTQDDWETWLKGAKANGLNMVQVYIFWNFHEEVEGQYNFDGRGNLTAFMQKAAAAGLFVNLRIGPYVCAEWTYGGLPAWLGLKDGVAFRQTNSVWQPAMKQWFNVIVDQMAKGNFFASQGGPIVLVQVENELPSTDKTYVEWCGTMAHEALDSVGVNVPVTMCNGETASTAINTCNGNDCTSFLEHHGQNGRVLVDQPALWTENEGGFQTWGGAPPPGKEPYFWGRPIADQTLSVMKWFARGGSHMNYYMWTGGNNFGRWTGDSITTMYAVDAAVCPDGLPHEPKFSQMTAMHEAIASAAASIVGAAVPSNPEKVPYGVAYVYNDVAFIEAAGNVNVSFHGHQFSVPEGSSSLVNLTSGATLFNTLTLASDMLSPQKRVLQRVPGLGTWTQWLEPVQGSDVAPGTYPPAAIVANESALDMTTFTQCLSADPTDLSARSARSTFALYETNLTLAGTAPAASVSIDTTQAMYLAVFIDGELQGTHSDYSHSNGATQQVEITLSAPTTWSSTAASHTLTILAEELGYANYGFKQGLKKGIVGEVSVKDSAGNAASLGTQWVMRGGLAGEHAAVFTPAGAANTSWTPVTSPARPLTWYQASFQTPSDVEAGAAKLFLNASGLNQGRVWVNGHDVGRYLQRERNDASACPAAIHPAPAPSPTTCSDPSAYNTSLNGVEMYGLDAYPGGNPSADACFALCCAKDLQVWQWGSQPPTGPGGGGCWCGADGGKTSPSKDWVGGSRSAPSPAGSVCATQTFYYIPRSWLQSHPSPNTITLLESGGLSGDGYDLGQVTLTTATMEPAELDQLVVSLAGDVLTSVESCEF